MVASNVMLLPLALQWHSELSADKPEKTCQGYNEASAAALAEAGAGVRRGTLDDLDVLRSVAAASDGVVHLKHDTGEPSRHSARRSRTVTGRSSSRPGFGVAAGRVATEHDEPAAQGSGGIDTRLGTTRKIVARITGVRSCVMRLSPTVHGRGNSGFVSFLVAGARAKGVSGYIEDGSNQWAAVHRIDAARLFRLALEKAPAGAVLHANARRPKSMRQVSIPSQAPSRASTRRLLYLNGGYDGALHR